MTTLNYWLGKLQKLQLFGHGVKPLYVLNESTNTMYQVLGVEEVEGEVIIKIQE